MPPLEACSPGRHSNVENAPRSTASHQPASHANLRYTARNFENAPVTRRSLITNQQRAHTPCKLGFALCCHSNATRAPIANPPNSAQLGGSLYHAPKLHPGPCSSVGIWPWTDRQTDTHRHAWPQYILRRLRLTQNVTSASWYDVTHDNDLRK